MIVGVGSVVGSVVGAMGGVDDPMGVVFAGLLQQFLRERQGDGVVCGEQARARHASGGAHP